MISGIYKLSFSSGLFYIGRSDDIDRRWQEHMQAFQNGTAAQRMQLEYDAYGMPNFEVIYECHPDHCDLAESAIIQHCDRNYLLNTQFPRRITTQEWETMCDCQELLELSTCDHLRLIFQNTELLSQKNLEVYDLRHQLETRQAELNQLKSSGVYIGDEAKLLLEEYSIDNEVLNELLNDEVETSAELRQELDAIKNKLKTMTLWQRLFHWSW